MSANALDALLADLRAFLGVVGPEGRSLTGTGRLRLADVRAANALLAAPEALDHFVAGRMSGIRTEDEAPRVHFLRLLAEAAAVVELREGRLVATPRGVEVAAGNAPDIERLFADWWWRGAWHLLPHGWGAERGPEEDRSWTARELRSFGEAETPLAELGARFTRRFGPPAPVRPDHHIDIWARSVRWSCLEPLAAFGGCVTLTEHQRIEPFTEKGQAIEYDETVAFRLTPRGLALLDAALREPRTPARRTAIAERQPRPAVTAGPEPRSRAEEDAAAARRLRVALAHPEHFAAALRGEEAEAAATETRTHLLLHEGVQEMLESGDLPIANVTYRSLVDAGHDSHDVEHMLAEAVTREVLEAGEAGGFDLRRFASRIETVAKERFGRLEEAPASGIPAPALERLRSLPRSREVWEGDVRQLPREMRPTLGGDAAAVWVSQRQALPRGIAPCLDADDAATLLRGFLDAAQNPPPGLDRELPALLRVRDGATAAALREALSPLGIAVEVAPRLPALDLLLSTVFAFVAGEGSESARRRRRGLRRSRG